MLIDLEPAKPTFARVWVTGGVDDFVHAAHQWAATHANCGNPGSLDEHLSVDDHADCRACAKDGIRRVWFYCDACGRQQLVLGPPAGGDMPPIFPRIQ